MRIKGALILLSVFVLAACGKGKKENENNVPEESKQDISSNNIDSVNTVSTINNDSSHIEGTPVIDSNQDVSNIQNDIEQSVSIENTLDNQMDIPSISEETTIDTTSTEYNINNTEMNNYSSDVNNNV